MKTRHSQNFEFLFLFLLITLLPSDAAAQTVASRARIGGFAEDITYVTSGALKDQIAMMNGYELHAVSIAKKGVLTRICKIENSQIDQFAGGFTFVESEGLFVMNNDPHPNKLFFFDQTCSVKGTRTIQYLDSNYRPGHLEGMAYIPPSSPVFPDHLIMVAWDQSLSTGRLIIMKRDGVQVAEITGPDWPGKFFAGSGLGDVTFLAPDRLLVSIYHHDSLWLIDFNGNILSGPLPASGAIGMGEGVVQLSDGSLVATSYPQNLLVFDKKLSRQPQNDRYDTIGLGLTLPNGVAWDSDANRFLVIYDSLFTPGPPRIAGVTTTLDSSTPLIDLSAFPNTRQTVYLPKEDIVATLKFAPAQERAILLLNLNGTVNSQISLSPGSLNQNFGSPRTLAYLPGSDEFVVSFSGIPAFERQRLRVFSRAGALVRTIDLSATGAVGINGIEYFEDSQGGGGRLLLMSETGRMFVADLDGNSRNLDGSLLREFNSRVKLGVLTPTDLAAITSGPLAGSFAVLDGNGGEVVIFRLN